jgi:hypothetical protein
MNLRSGSRIPRLHNPGREHIREENGQKQNYNCILSHITQSYGKLQHYFCNFVV